MARSRLVRRGGSELTARKILTARGQRLLLKTKKWRASLDARPTQTTKLTPSSAGGNRRKFSSDRTGSRTRRQSSEKPSQQQNF